MIGITSLHLQPFIITDIFNWRRGANSGDLVRTYVLVNFDLILNWHEVKKYGVDGPTLHSFIQCKVGDIITGIYPYNGSKEYLDYNKSKPRINEADVLIDNFLSIHQQ